jgi:hypothetical protein
MLDSTIVAFRKSCKNLIPHHIGRTLMIPWRNFPKMSRETIVAGTVLDLSKSFNIEKIFPT